MTVNLRSLGRVALFMGVALSPVYVFESGGIQVANYFMILFVLLNAVRAPRYRLNVSDFALLFFLLYSWLREALAYTLGAPIQTMITSVHITFVVLLYLFSSKEISERRELIGLANALVLASLVALLGVLLSDFTFLSGRASVRTTGTFNNPNQLGYFAVCLAVLSCFFYNLNLVGIKRFLLMLLVAIFLSMVSLSKSSAISVMFLCLIQVFYLLNAGSPNRVIPALALSVAVLFFLILLGEVFGFSLFDRSVVGSLAIVDRLLNMAAESDTSASVRGYGIIFSSSFFEILFGVSSYESAQRHGGYEVHSTLMSQITYYGLIGSSSLVYFFWRWIRKVYLSYGVLIMLSVCAPPMLYGLAHNGIRFSIFWLLVAISFSGVNRSR